MSLPFYSSFLLFSLLFLPFFSSFSSFLVCFFFLYPLQKHEKLSCFGVSGYQKLELTKFIPLSFESSLSVSIALPSGPAFVNALTLHPLCRLLQKASLVSKLSSILEPRGPCFAHARASHSQSHLLQPTAECRTGHFHLCKSTVSYLSTLGSPCRDLRLGRQVLHESLTLTSGACVRH